MQINKSLATSYFPKPWKRVLDKVVLRFSRKEKRSIEKYETAIKDGLYFSLKQVPSALAIKACGDVFLKRNPEIAQSMGFRLHAKRKEGDEFIVDSFPDNFSKSTYASVLSHLYGEDNNFKVEDISDTEYTKIKYEDPWLTLASCVYASMHGKRPDLRVWPVTSVTLEQPVPFTKLREDRRMGMRRKRKVLFVNMLLHDESFDFIMNNTHWGKYITQCRYGNDRKVIPFAKRFRTKVRLFLRGEKLYEYNHLYSEGWKPNRKKRHYRFLEMLKTVDGMFTQRFAAHPEESWTWEKYDQFNLRNIDLLLNHEFLDGKLGFNALNVVTAYQSLKKVRKMCKGSLLKGNPHHAIEFIDNSMPEFQYFSELVRLVPEEKHSRCYQIAVLSQTRGAGMPPPLLLLQSKVKFIKTVTEEPEPLTLTERGLIRAAFDSLIETFEGSEFTGLKTKARISVTAAACWEKTRHDNGTISAINDIVKNGAQGVPVEKIDLDTGQPDGRIYYIEATAGEYIFWACLREVLSLDPSEVSDAFLAIVSDPGKARSITKARACLKIVLDMTSKICTWPLKKIPSSKSGVGMEAHGWNLYNDFFTDRMRDIVFDVAESQRGSEYEDHTDVIETLRPAFVAFMDYNEATDHMLHEVARILVEPWMTLCGIPRLLKSIVLKTCYRERDIYFKAEGLLSKFGEPVGDNTNKVRLRRGVMMGDPMTKLALHLVNMVSRQVPSLARKAHILSRYFKNPVQIQERLRANLVDLPKFNPFIRSSRVSETSGWLFGQE